MSATSTSAFACCSRRGGSEHEHALGIRPMALRVDAVSRQGWENGAHAMIGYCKSYAYLPMLVFSCATSDSSDVSRLPLSVGEPMRGRSCRRPYTDFSRYQRPKATACLPSALVNNAITTQLNSSRLQETYFLISILPR